MQVVPCSLFPKYWGLNHFKLSVDVACVLLHFNPTTVGKPGVVGVGWSLQIHLLCWFFKYHRSDQVA